LKVKVAEMNRYCTILLLAAVVTGSIGCSNLTNPAAPASKPAASVDSGVDVPPEIAVALKRIDAAGAYAVPDIPVRTDTNYAYTPGELKPFGYVQPFKQNFLQQIEYTGPGRAIPEPDKLDTVKIGFIGPIKSTVSVATGGKLNEEPLGVKMLQGAQLAIEQANAKGGYAKRNIPFELVVKNDNGLWGASGNTIIDLAYKDKVWAILGTIDGANSHIAIRVALKIEIFVMNSGDTDPTFIETNIPWVARCIGDDRQQGYLLVDYLYHKLDKKRVGIIRASSRYGRFGVREINDSSRRLERPIIIEMAYPVGSDDFALQIERLKKENLDAVIHWGNDADGAKILNQMRAMGMTQPFFACDRCVSDTFLQIAGKNAEGVVCPFSWNPDSDRPELAEFRRAFKARFGDEPETQAVHAYDGMNMLIESIRMAGLNRARIRDMFAYRTTPWKGVTGDIKLSAVLDDVGEVWLAKRENDRWHYYSRADLGLPLEPASGTEAPAPTASR
jgi:branched-chain amino acid transport system substrate-binding protein